MEKLRNRLFACGTAAFMLMSGLPLQTAQTAFAAEIAAAARGDVNGDGKKDGDDLDALTRLLGEHVETLFTKEQYVQYDITEDGIIDVRDRYALSQYLSGAANELPVSPSSDLDDEVTLTMKMRSASAVMNSRLCFLSQTGTRTSLHMTLQSDLTQHLHSKKQNLYPPKDNMLQAAEL